MCDASSKRENGLHFSPTTSVSEKIEDITEHAAVCFVDFSVLALSATDRRKLFCLDVENLGEKAACRPEFADFVRRISAFCATELQRFHGFPPVRFLKWRPGGAAMTTKRIPRLADFIQWCR